jgi:hypothetical protein
MKKAFDKMCLLMAANALAAYPDHNMRFDIHTDASDFQLGTFIVNPKFAEKVYGVILFWYYK